jgi:hypothetical protein
MKRHPKTTKRPNPSSTPGASGLMGFGALFVGALLDRPTSGASDSSKPSTRSPQW